MKGDDSGSQAEERRAAAAERLSLQERLSEWLDLPLAVLSLVWTGLVIVDLAMPLSAAASARVRQVDTAIWAVFAAVFALELALAPDKVRYLRTHVLAAVSVVLPFARVVRIVRLGRLLRSVSLVRLALIANRATVGIAELLSRHQFQYVLALVVVVTFLGAAGVHFFERDLPGSPFADFGESLWWTATMVTTVNTGAEPRSVEGRLIALLLRVFGLGVFGYVAGSFASFLVERRVGSAGERQAGLEGERETLAALHDEVARLRRAVERLDGTHPEASAPPSDKAGAPPSPARTFGAKIGRGRPPRGPGSGGGPGTPTDGP